MGESDNRKYSCQTRRDFHGPDHRMKAWLRRRGEQATTIPLGFDMVWAFSFWGARAAGLLATAASRRELFGLLTYRVLRSLH
jgi:hypothetical protein